MAFGLDLNYLLWHDCLNSGGKYGSLLTLKAPSKICSRHSIFFFCYFSEKTSLDISCESSAKQMIHMKCQDLFSRKNKNKKKLSSAAVVIGALKVNNEAK